MLACRMNIVSLIFFRITWSPKATSFRVGDRSGYSMYETHVKSRDRFMCLRQCIRLSSMILAFLQSIYPCKAVSDLHRYHYVTQRIIPENHLCCTCLPQSKKYFECVQSQIIPAPSCHRIRTISAALPYPKSNLNLLQSRENFNGKFVMFVIMVMVS